MSSSAIAPLAALPLFHQLEGRKAVVIGASPAADWKAELLAASGANVERLSTWTEEALAGTAIAVGDFPDRDEASRFREAARNAGALVNIIDSPQECDVQFGTIVNRSPIVIGISTAGGAPMLGQSIRVRIESVVPTGLSAWAGAAREWRPRIKQAVADFASRRAFWKLFVQLAWDNADRAPTAADFKSLVEADVEPRGRVVLIDVWNRDAEFLTLKAVRAMQSATVILHDQGIGRDVLELARREARRIVVDPDCRALIVKLASEGETVACLVPARERAFDQFAPEIEACQRAGLEVRSISCAITERALGV